MTKQEYIRKMYSILVPMCTNYGYYNVAAGMIAQSIQEGWNSGLATKYHNYWGMKAGSNYKGKKIAMNNKAGNDPAVYRVFASMEDGCRGYFDFLAYPRYQALKQCKSDREYLNKIGPCGWNSNIGYGGRCISHLDEVYDAIGTTEEEKNLPTLKRGDRGTAVMAWQNYLRTCGIDVGKYGADGIFGKDTENAVLVYQLTKNLPATGVIDLDDWNSVGK